MSEIPCQQPYRIARVALDLPVDRFFDYLAAQATDDDLGRRVEVPFGKGRRIGVLLELVEHSELQPDALKPLLSIDRRTPPLPDELLAVARFAAGYYRHPLGAVLASLLPPALRQTERPRRAATPMAYALNDAGRAALADLPARARVQRTLVERLTLRPLAQSELSDREKTLLRDWLRQGWVSACQLASSQLASPGPALTAEQTAALEQLHTAPAGFSAWLLFGVTGSGKTEVYLRRIAEVLAAGQQALVLVPEIHLTHQLLERLEKRFPDQRLISLHSNLAEGERRRAWLQTLHGEADIILGTRLAVFAPLPRLGLIVVDEEHDGAYKQLEGMRYSARDVAVWRARQRGVPVILGSATPSLESWKNTREGRYRLLNLPSRAHAEAVLPAVRLIDTRNDRSRMGLSGGLLEALKKRLAAGEQSLVFINRRGYAPSLLCNGCGHVFPCPRCSAHLVLHRQTGGGGYRLTCHHCGLTVRPPEVCPDCGNVDLRASGQGTQRVEETLAEHFPDARLLRIDRDTTTRKGAFASMREQVAARDVDILVGTQIIAKGHDFPHLTLVGVIGADQALMSPDFRAGERLFAQLMQVAGRAGRAEHPGEVLIQTRYPTHPLYQSLTRHDYPGYASLALKERRAAEFPPYAAQAILRAEGRDDQAVLAFLLAAREAAQGLAKGVRLFDPVPALMSRIANRHRAQLLVQAGQRGALQAFLRAWSARLDALPIKGIRWGLDVDPIDI